MRIAFSLAVTLLLLAPSRAAAGPVIEFGFLNSDLTFGFVNPDQEGWDLYLLSKSWSPDELNPDDFSGEYRALSGPFAQLTVERDTSGTVIGSEYLYEGGMFRLDLQWLNDDGELRTGSFAAPIITLAITVFEDPYGSGSHYGALEASYGLGPGLFDASIANALGIRRHTTGGGIRSQLNLTDTGNREGTGGNYTSVERQAWDGVAYVDIGVNVPEPPLPILSVLGLSAAWFSRRRSMGN